MRDRLQCAIDALCQPASNSAVDHQALLEAILDAWYAEDWSLDAVEDAIEAAGIAVGDPRCAQ